jgi:hypothetical protein
MKASPFSPLLLISLLFGLSVAVAAQSGAYTVQVDSMTAQDTAESKVLQLKAQGQNAYWLKSNIPGQGIRYRVRIGRFPTRAAAQNYGMRLKQQGVTADFFVALFEGTSSPLGANEQAKKPAPQPIPPPSLTKPTTRTTTETKAVSNKPTTPLATPATNKAAENQTPSPVAAPAQRQREVKSSVGPSSGVSEKPVTPAPTNGTTTAPGLVRPEVPRIAPPVTPAPQAAPASPSEYKPLQSKPLVPTPVEESKPPRDRKASIEPPPTTTSNALVSAAAAKGEIVAATPKTVIESAPSSASAAPAAEATAASAKIASFQRFEERNYGYSFEHPAYWSGGRLSSDELQVQRIDAGAVFRSQEDVAFMNAIWNSLKNANSPAYDNNLIVDLVIKSLSSGTGLQGLNEISRRMVQEGDQVKTFVDMRTLFRQPRTNQAMEFQGKAVIIRANTGILLVVTFFSKDSAPTMIAAADRIIGSARVP